jgi:hypothetical protein
VEPCQASVGNPRRRIGAGHFPEEDDKLVTADSSDDIVVANSA